MTARGARRLARAIFALVLVELAVSLAFELARAGLPALGDGAYAATFLLFPIVGLLLATRRPENALGWIMLGIGVAAFLPAESYGKYALESDLPGGDWAIGSTAWTWIPTIGLAGTFLMLLFPDGRLPSPRWRWFAWAIGVGMVVASIGILFGTETLADLGYPNVRNPFAVEGVRPLLAVAIAAIAIIPIGIIGSAASLVIRHRRSGPTERLQIRWLAAAAVLVAVVYAITMVASLSSVEEGWATGGGWLEALQVVATFLFALLPLSIGIAVLRYRLYEIDVVIRKAVIVTAIGALFTAVYVGIVGGIGALVGSRLTTTLSFVSAAMVAALFQPALRWSRRLADRIVYGRRATPYEVLSEFSERVGETYADDDVLPRMARVVAEGVGAERADVWLKVGDRLRVAASWPSEVEPRAPATIAGDAVTDLPGADASFPVEHQGELFGALSVTMPAAEPMDDAKAKLVAGLTGQAGLVLRNVRLSEDLRLRFEELKAAQKRLVSAQDAERRRLERNIHDGAQQQLVALSVKLRLAQSLVEREPPKAAAMLEALRAQATETLEDLRDLARGIYPPLLADKGLAAALQAQVRKSPIDVALSPDGVGRYPQEVEAAVYFSVLEALQNVAKHANATRTTVRLAVDRGDLTFEVDDDGVGFDPAMRSPGTGLQGIADRLGALEGTLHVRSVPGEGTTVTGRIPVADGRR